MNLSSILASCPNPVGCPVRPPWQRLHKSRIIRFISQGVPQTINRRVQSGHNAARNSSRVTNSRDARATSSKFETIAAEKPKLVFDQMGGVYFFRQIWFANGASGFELRRSNTEARLALNAAPTEQVTVAGYTTQK
jgi:hypothetical protein